jgi:D-alanine transaminase
MEIAVLNDKILPLSDLDPVYFDRGTFFGDGVYEVIRSYNGRIFALEDHLNRFSRSLAEIRITAVNIDDVRQRVLKAFESASIGNARIYFHITRGSAPRDHRWTDDLKPNFFLTVTDLPDSTQSKLNGVAVITYPDLRWKRCDIKSLNLLPNVLARQDAAQKGAKEAILVNEAGFITEGAASSFFAVFGKTVRTAPLQDNILPSITRKYVLQAALNARLTVAEKHFTPAEAMKADELFIAVTTQDIVGVVKFDDKVIGCGKPGNITKQLEEAFLKFTK